MHGADAAQDPSDRVQWASDRRDLTWVVHGPFASNPVRSRLLRRDTDAALHVHPSDLIPRATCGSRRFGRPLDLS